MNINQITKVKPPKGTGAALAAILGLGAAGSLVYSSIYNVEGGQRAIIFNKIFGVRNTIYAEGTHFRIPFIEKPVIYDVKIQPRNVSSHTGSRDLQMINISVRVLHKPNEDMLPFIYRNLGTDFDERVLPSIGIEVMKSVVAKYNAIELLTKRKEVSDTIRQRMITRAKDFHIMIEDVSITHLAFGKEYTAAVEAKQVAQQDAERAKFVVEKAIQEKQSAIIRAQGEARSATLIGRAMRENPGFLELRKIEAAKDIAQTLSRSANRIFLNSDALLMNMKVDQVFVARAVPVSNAAAAYSPPTTSTTATASASTSAPATMFTSETDSE